jgi:HK97 family phage prohead protease
MEKETRTFSGAIEYRDGEDRPIVGYAAVFNSLSENLGGFREMIAPGAFDNVLGDDVRALINHDANLILGRTKAGTLTLRADDKGLYYDIAPGQQSYFRDLVESVKRGDIDQSSFAFTVDDDKWEEDKEGRVIRTIKSVRRLYDVSPVTYPAYPDASVGVKRMQEWRSETTETEVVIPDEVPQIEPNDDLALDRMRLVNRLELMIREDLIDNK